MFTGGQRDTQIGCFPSRGGEFGFVAIKRLLQLGDLCFLRTDSGFEPADRSSRSAIAAAQQENADETQRDGAD